MKYLLISAMLLSIPAYCVMDGTNEVSYRVVSIIEETESSKIQYIGRRISHIRMLMDINGINTKRSYISTPYYKALVYIEQDEIDYALLYLDITEMRMRENNIWVDIKDETQIITLGE